MKGKVLSSLSSLNVKLPDTLQGSSVVDESPKPAFQPPDITDLGGNALKWLSEHLPATTLPDGVSVPEIDTSVLDGTPFSGIVQQVIENPLLAAPVAQVGIVVAAVLFSQMNSSGDDASYTYTPSTSNDNQNGNDNQKRDGDEIYATTGRYNPTDASRYYSSRPLDVIIRTLTIALYATQFLSKIGFDIVTGKFKDYDRELERADELSGLLTTLGPAFIKIGQSLSVRTDLLRPSYVVGLTKLQDCVPAFSTFQAQSIICQELGVSNVQDVFLDLDENTPVVAAASLGQVYKARLRYPDNNSNGDVGNEDMETDTYVAIKVQRPGIVKSISLDLYIIRSLVPILKEAGKYSLIVTITLSL